MDEKDNKPTTKRKKKITNPSPEDFQDNKNVVTAVPKSEYIEKESDLPLNAQTLKPKSSKYEPDPKPFKLPSGRVVIQKNLTQDGKIAVRRMTSIEEGFVKGLSTDKALRRVMNKIIEKCVKTNVDYQQLALFDKVPLFVFIISLTYGNKHKVTVECPTCRMKHIEKMLSEDKPVPFTETQEITIDLSKDVNIKYLPQNFKYPYPIKLKSYPKDDITAFFRGPLIMDEDFMFDDETSFDQQLTAFTIDVRGFFEGNPITENEHREIINNTGHEDRQTFRKFILDFSGHGSDMTLKDFQCNVKTCEKFAQDQEIDLPLDDVFTQIFYINT
jgi:hypothetical protein